MHSFLQVFDGTLTGAGASKAAASVRTPAAVTPASAISAQGVSPAAGGGRGGATGGFVDGQPSEETAPSSPMSNFGLLQFSDARLLRVTYGTDWASVTTVDEKPIRGGASNPSAGRGVAAPGEFIFTIPDTTSAAGSRASDAGDSCQSTITQPSLHIGGIAGRSASGRESLAPPSFGGVGSGGESGDRGGHLLGSPTVPRSLTASDRSLSAQLPELGAIVDPSLSSTSHYAVPSSTVSAAGRSHAQCSQRSMFAAALGTKVPPMPPPEFSSLSGGTTARGTTRPPQGEAVGVSRRTPSTERAAVAATRMAVGQTGAESIGPGSVTASASTAANTRGHHRLFVRFQRTDNVSDILCLA